MATRLKIILLVEDNPHDALLIMKALERRELCELRAVEDGVQALSYLRSKGDDLNHLFPDLILLDLRLPKMSGHELLAEIKGDSDLRHIPVLVLSNSGGDHDVNTSYALHANCYIEQAVDFWLNTVLLPR